MKAISNQKTISFDININAILYVLAILIGVGLRLFRLGAAPLSDTEASWALQALELARGGSPMIGPQPFYVLITSLIFSVFGHFNALARLVPALSGSALILLPWLIQRRLISSRRLQRAGIFLAFFLAIDPGLTTLSRVAGSPMPALVFTSFTLVCFYCRQPILTGVFAALALLSGPEAFQGLLIIAVSLILIRFFETRGWLGIYPRGVLPLESELPPNENPPSFLFNWRLGAAFLIGTLLLVGTILLRIPQGFGAMADALVNYLHGWTSLSGIPALRLPLALVAYQLLGVVFAIACLVRIPLSPNRFRFSLLKEQSPHQSQSEQIQDELLEQITKRIGIWLLVALIINMLYPRRQVADLMWALLPVWALASLEISRHFPETLDSADLMVTVGHTALIVILFILAGYTLLRITTLQAGALLYAGISIGVILMGIVATLMVAAGWSVQSAETGLAWGSFLVLSILLFAGAWNSSQTFRNSPNELWTSPPAVGQEQELMVTLQDLSDWNKGWGQGLDLIVTSNSPSLQWALRDFAQSTYQEALTSTDLPAVIIAPADQEQPNLLASYRGQDFNWQVSPAWTGILPPDWLLWVAYHQAPAAATQIILWARLDLFPGGALAPTGNPSP
jgi:hypothetical protein